MNWGLLLAGLAGGLVLTQLLQPQGQMPQPQQPQQFTPPPAAQPNGPATPDYGALVRANGKAAARSGPSSTFRSGAKGVDPSKLNLGTNSLLGA